jgi:hypothetical protein
MSQMKLAFHTWIVVYEGPQVPKDLLYPLSILLQDWLALRVTK